MKLPEAFKLISFWGFEFVTILFVYNKKSKNKDVLMLGFGYYTRGQCEYLIMAKRSSISHFLRNKHSVGQKV